MSSPPTVVTRRRRQHQLLRSWSGWGQKSILIDPAEIAQVRRAGWAGTHHCDPDTGERIVGTPDGLAFGVDETWRLPVEVVTWSEIEAIAKSVADEVREQLTEFRARWFAHQSAYPRFPATAAATGCGPILAGEPLTPRQRVYVRELKDSETSGARAAWKQRPAALDAERLGLHASALPLGGDGKPGDLLEVLEVLEDLQRHNQAPRPGLRPPQPCSRDWHHRREAAASNCPIESEVAR